MVPLEQADHQALLDRQALLNTKKFEFEMLTLAYNVVKSHILTKYGLDPNGNYKIDNRGIVTTLPFVPPPEGDPAPT